jgi:hypothetical protein
VLPDIFERDSSLQFFSQHFLPADLKITFGNTVEDSNSPFGIRKDDRLLKISQENLREVLICSVHPESITP